MEQSNIWLEIAFAVGLGLTGWYLGARARLPSAPIIGSMVLVGLVACFHPFRLSPPNWMANALQIVLGTAIGHRVTPEALARLRTMTRPMLIAVAWTIFSALLVGYVLALASGMDLPTALLSTTPGGLPELSIVAISLGANVSLVSTLQSIRLLATVLVIPILARQAAFAGGAVRVAPSVQPSARSTRRNPHPPASAWQWAWPFAYLLGLAGGLVALALQIPAGGLLGSMIAVAIARGAAAPLARPPVRFSILAQACYGILIGLTFTAQTLEVLRAAAPVVVLTTAATLFSGILLGYVLRFAMSSTLPTALLATAPGGLTQMTLMAEELGAETLEVTVFHLTRLFSILLILPLLFQLLV